jgi:hypothetical protein
MKKTKKKNEPTIISRWLSQFKFVKTIRDKQSNKATKQIFNKLNTILWKT